MCAFNTVCMCHVAITRCEATPLLINPIVGDIFICKSRPFANRCGLRDSTLCSLARQSDLRDYNAHAYTYPPAEQISAGCFAEIPPLRLASPAEIRIALCPGQIAAPSLTLAKPYLACSSQASRGQAAKPRPLVYAPRRGPRSMQLCCSSASCRSSRVLSAPLA